ncbi:sugar O-acetyltransferase [Myroides sp. JBRI-B21084]|uniref:sugar O-acetyltransferase n=1 Tax=Myroides sp. JBRI-B21084 TaxID=3119977 RepID=UPI0026E160DF|nr:sugar O-acetyltransferase [Paenimyroides cloacae]WKW46888.1 sugar O-acetyltransferase [Paenimyroides cloacae]
MTELEKMRNGEYYKMEDPEILKIQNRAIELCEKIDKLSFSQINEKNELLKDLFGTLGKNASIKPGFKCDIGKNIHIGDNFLTNFDVTILDIGTVTIGNNVWMGPKVGIYAVGHPMEAEGRKKYLGIGKPVNIGDNVWIGGSVVILMGVNIGDNVVIGSGAVVTKDIPDNAVVVGNPAKIVKYIEN